MLIMGNLDNIKNVKMKCPTALEYREKCLVLECISFWFCVIMFLRVTLVT